MSLVGSTSRAPFRKRGNDNLKSPVAPQAAISSVAVLPPGIVEHRKNQNKSEYGRVTNDSSLDVWEGELVFVSDSNDSSMLGNHQGPFLHAFSSFTGLTEAQARTVRVIGLANGPAKAEEGLKQSFTAQRGGTGTTTNTGQDTIRAGAIVYARPPGRSGNDNALNVQVRPDGKIPCETIGRSFADIFSIITELQSAHDDENSLRATAQKYAIAPGQNGPIFQLAAMYSAMRGQNYLSDAAGVLMGLGDSAIPAAKRSKLGTRGPLNEIGKPNYSHMEAVHLLRLQARAFFELLQLLDSYRIGRSLRTSQPGEDLYLSIGNV